MFNFQKKDIVSIVGAGGKTTLMLYLAKKLKGNVVVSTSTKIFLENSFECQINTKISFEKNSRIITGKDIVNGKIVGFNFNALKSNYDYILIEADGSKEMSLKGWNDFEPVIIDESNITIGVIDISTIGKPTKSTVFRMEEFEKITKVEEKINIKNLFDVITHKDGMFKYSEGKKFLFINKVEDEYNRNKAIELSGLVHDYVDEIVYGSLYLEEFEVVK